MNRDGAGPVSLDDVLVTRVNGADVPTVQRWRGPAAGGLTLRFSDARASDLESNPASAPDFGTAVDGTLGARLSVPGYMDTGDSAIVSNENQSRERNTFGFDNQRGIHWSDQHS